MKPTLETIQEFAPYVYLHPYDHHRPTSVEEYLKILSAFDSNGNLLEESPTKESISKLTNEDNYLAWKEGLSWPTRDINVSTGMKLNGNECVAPCYVHVIEKDSYVDIIYCFLYEFNGFQTFRAGIGKFGGSTKKRNFEWANFARHQGDWEHITVRLSTDLKFQGVFYSRHGKSHFETTIERNGTHPVVYSALNSHASYSTPGTETLADIADTGGWFTAPIHWLKAVDICQTNDALRVYNTPDPLFDNVIWDTSKSLQVVNSNEPSGAWLNFMGRWGLPDMDNSSVKLPPPMPHDAENTLKTIANLGKFIKKLPVQFLRGSGPRGPKGQGWFQSQEK